MRILHINTNYLLTALHQTMIEHLEKTGCQSVVFADTYNKTHSAIIPNDNVIVSECFRKNDRWLFDYKQSKIIRALEASCNVSDFDVSHAYTLFTDGNAAYQMHKKYGVPFVVAVRNTDINTFFKYRLNLRKRGREILSAASRIFFLSEAYRTRLLEKYIPKNMKEELFAKSEIIPNGIDDFWFENLYGEKDVLAATERLAKKQLKIVYAGGIDNNKNVTATCAAADILHKQGWEVDFTVVGKIIDNTVFEKIGQRVNYLEARPKEQLIDVYRDNDIFVMPSLHETFGLVYAEAMTQGLPVIYTQGEGFDRQFEDGKVGYSVNPKSPEDIADKILKIAGNYESISNNCLGLCNKFRWDDIVTKYNTLYKELL